MPPGVHAMPRQTTFAKPGEINRQWHLIDADDQVLGRLATQIATILMGKHRPSWTPHVDCGDFVVVINADCLHDFVLVVVSVFE